MIHTLYTKYTQWRDKHAPDQTSTSPKTGREVTPQRIRKGPQFVNALVRSFSKN